MKFFIPIFLWVFYFYGVESMNHQSSFEPNVKQELVKNFVFTETKEDGINENAHNVEEGVEELKNSGSSECEYDTANDESDQNEVLVAETSAYDNDDFFNEHSNETQKSSPKMHKAKTTQESGAVIENEKIGIFGRFNFVPTFLGQMKNAVFANSNNISVDDPQASSSSRQKDYQQTQQIEETEEKWNQIFMMENMMKKKWLCPERIDNDRANNDEVIKCEQLRIANKALQKYLDYHILKNLILTENEFKKNNAAKVTDKKMKANRQEMEKERDDLLVVLALKPTFLHLVSDYNNNVSTIKIILLKAYKHFNIAPSQNIAEFEKITENFANQQNCEKVWKLAKAFKIRKALAEKMSQESDNKTKRTAAKQAKKLSKALEKIKIGMEKDSDFCTNCEIPSVEEVLTLSPLLMKISPSFAEHTKEFKQKLAKKFYKFVK